MYEYIEELGIVLVNRDEEKQKETNENTTNEVRIWESID